MRLWASLGLEQDPGTFPFGSNPIWGILTGTKTVGDYLDESYAQFKHKKIWGFYGIMGQPHLVINDFELLRDIFIKVYHLTMYSPPTINEPKIILQIKPSLQRNQTKSRGFEGLYLL